MKRHAKVVVAALTLLLAIGGGTAFALNGHAPSPANPFLEGLTNPQALAVDQSSGELYVLDVGDSTVKRFDSSGAPADFSALGSNAIDAAGGGDCAGTPADCDETPQGGFAFDSPSAAQLAIDRSGGPADGYIYVTNSLNAVVNVFDVTGTYKGRLPNTGGEPCGVAVDPSGNVFVANTGTGRVYRYAPAADPAEASFEGQLQNLSSPCNLAVDSSGNVYVVPQFGGALVKYESSQFGVEVPSGQTIDENATAVYLDPTTDHVYADEGNQVAHYDSAGNLIQRFGADELSESHGVAINAATSTVYASDSADGQVSAFVPAILPDATTEPATAVIDTSATLNGTIDPTEGAPAADCEFKWGTDTSYGNTAPCAPAGPYTEATAASADLSGLTPGTEYHFRIVGSSAEGSNPGADRAFTTVGLPILSELSVSDVGLDSATLHAQINPAGSATSYRFEYVTETEFEANGFANAIKAPVPDGTIAAGSSPLAVSQELSGLTEQTAYRYRLVATNGAGPTTSAESRLTTTRPAGEFALPEGRRWEMVSPREKEGADVRTDTGRTRALADGDKLFFTSLRAFGGAHGTGIATEYMAERRDGGWGTHAVTPLLKPQSFERDLFSTFDPRFVGELSADGTTGVFTSHDSLAGPSNVEAVRNLYLRRDMDAPGGGTYELLSDAFAPITRAPSPLLPAYAGASEDFSHVVFGSRLNLTADAKPQNNACLVELNFGQCQPRLYEHTDAGVRLVGQIPKPGETSCSGAACEPAVRSIARSANVIAYPHWVISEDGSRIFFTVGSTTSSLRGNLYVREDGTTTHQVNASQKDPPGETGPSQLRVTSADGSKAFFTTGAQLLDEDTDSESEVDLYRYDLDAPEGSRLTLISADEQKDDGGDSVAEVYGASDDGEYVYFTNPSQLVEDGPILGSGTLYLYMWHAGETKLVGTVDTGALDAYNDSENWALGTRRARVTPDGSHILFVSRALDLLTGNVSPALCPTETLKPCGRAYVYDATANGGEGELHCASCLPDGAQAMSDATWTPFLGRGGASSDGHLNQAITDDGRLAFFSTSDRLVPEDSNGRYDVYAYDTLTGAARLLSSGSCNCDSWFVDASPDGSDVFFTTREQLVGWDTDNLMDIYDARSGGGFPEPPPPAPSCQGDACQPPPVALNDPTPASSAFAGAGNANQRKPKARHCPTGKRAVKSHGKARCVKKNAKQKNRNRASNDRRASR